MAISRCTREVERKSQLRAASQERHPHIICAPTTVCYISRDVSREAPPTYVCGIGRLPGSVVCYSGECHVSKVIFAQQSHRKPASTYQKHRSGNPSICVPSRSVEITVSTFVKLVNIINISNQCSCCHHCPNFVNSFFADRLTCGSKSTSFQAFCLFICTVQLQFNFKVWVQFVL